MVIIIMAGNGLKGFYSDMYNQFVQWYHLRLQLSIFHLIGHTLGFYQQAPCTAC